MQEKPKDAYEDASTHEHYTRLLVSIYTYAKQKNKWHNYGKYVSNIDASLFELPAMSH